MDLLDKIIGEEPKVEEEIKVVEAKQEEQKEDYFDVDELFSKKETSEIIKSEELEDSTTLEAFMVKELMNEKNLEIKDLLENSPGLPSFAEFLEWKFTHKDIFLVDIGSPLETILYGSTMDKFFITTFKSDSYYDFIETYGSISKNKRAYFKFLIEKCLLFPKNLNLDSTPAGVTELLIGAILKNSKLESDFEIKRL